MSTAEQSAKRESFFEEVYDGFYTYFTAQLSKTPSKYDLYRLQHMTQYFDDVELQRIVFPIFERGVSSVGEKQAAARAALYDALLARTYGQFLGTAASQLANQVEEQEKRVNELERRLNKIATELKNAREEKTGPTQGV